MNPATLAAERDKYRRMWALPEYHGSPGLQVAPDALDWFYGLGCSSLTDWGCGDGQALEWFRQSRVEAHGLDLVNVAPDHLDVTEAPISEPGDLPTTDFAFSADVLEHLPPDEVDVSLQAIRKRTTTGGFFQVFTNPDGCGKLIGETLHLTVRPGRWWVDTVDRYFNVSQYRIFGNKVRLWLTT